MFSFSFCDSTHTERKNFDIYRITVPQIVLTNLEGAFPSSEDEKSMAEMGKDVSHWKNLSFSNQFLTENLQEWIQQFDSLFLSKNVKRMCCLKSLALDKKNC